MAELTGRRLRNAGNDAYQCVGDGYRLPSGTVDAAGRVE